MRFGLVRAVVAALTMSLPAAGALASGDDAGPEAVFEKRILPIFKSPDPSSCVQCHLAGVDLKHYILPSSEKTFQSLRHQGLVDLDRPEDSKILRLIRMGSGDRSGAALPHAKARKAEYEAFAAWILAAVRDPALRKAPPLDPAERAGPPRPPEVIRHARTDRVLAAFEDTVWAMRFRCMGCHSEGTPQNAKHVEKFGERVAWMKTGGAAATLDYLRRSRLIDVKDPANSLLLRKPLNAVKHEGGRKFAVGDQGYKAYRAFLEEFARTAGDGYRTAAELPVAPAGPERFGTDVWIKLADTPPAWGDRLLLVNVYARDAADRVWEGEPVATSDRVVWGKGRLWQHNLTLLAARGSERAKTWRAGRPALPPGKYLVRVYVDRDDRLARDWKAVLGPGDCVGEVEVESSWPENYDRMTTVAAGRVRPPSPGPAGAGGSGEGRP
jgi:hypothetical protein